MVSGPSLALCMSQGIPSLPWILGHIVPHQEVPVESHEREESSSHYCVDLAGCFCVMLERWSG